MSRKHFLEEGAPVMIGGQFTVLGKVTRVPVNDGDEIVLLRRSLFRYFGQEATQAVSKFVLEKGPLNLRLPRLVVRKPAVQLLPLAVFT
jgi:hypothetical protein